MLSNQINYRSVTFHYPFYFFELIRPMLLHDFDTVIHSRIDPEFDHEILHLLNNICDTKYSFLSKNDLFPLISDVPIICISIKGSTLEENSDEHPPFRSLNVEHITIVCSITNLPISGLGGGGRKLVWNDRISDIAAKLSIAGQKLMQRTPQRCVDIDQNIYLKFGMIGRSPAFLKSARQMLNVARSDARVMISGETGTGKEVSARAIHYFGRRSKFPFIPVNCGAFSDELLLSELFGHKKGAFTGASEGRVGLLELAQGGSLFLDEVDALSERAQVALLRFLQDGEIRPLGSNELIKVDVRIISATNKNIYELVSAGKFRDDLVFRLDVLSVSLPPLRKRGNDIHQIIQYYLSKFSNEFQCPAKYLGPRVTKAVEGYNWPGNFRQLESAIMRIFLSTEESILNSPEFLFSSNEYINSGGLEGAEISEILEISEIAAGSDSSDSSDSSGQILSFSREKSKLISRFEHEYIQRVLKLSKGNISKAALIANKERRAFTRLMEKHGVSRKSYL